ncbi:MAG: potassium-transporting ATPase subunit KdpA [Silvanigrellales bacterium]|nr:potassium-transporting ATPase subunit KdpA [Silvanigrellales bacterium]
MNSFFDIAHVVLFLAVAFVTVPFVSKWLSWTFRPEPMRIDSFANVIIGSRGGQDWKAYAGALMAFNCLGIVVLLAILMLQSHLPFNPQGLPGLPFDLALNTAISFVTNTNWQAYSGESTLSFFSQMFGLGTQNFVSAAVGFGVMCALARGIRSRQSSDLGNFWVDLTRGTCLILLPLAALWTLILVSQGVIQNFSAYVDVNTLEGAKQTLPMGPAASQIAIKQLGTNGGGFFGLNSAHPFENPTFFSNFVQVLGIVLLPLAAPLAFGELAGNRRHGRTLFTVMGVLLLGALGFSLWSELQGNPIFGGAPFLEGKELRFGIGHSVLWGTVTTATSNGSVNAMMSSLSPLAGGIAMFQMMLGEIIYGGVGSGVYGLFLYAILTVFIAGLMVGRSPEFLGKKIEAPEIKLAVIGVLLPSVLILGSSAIAVMSEAGLKSLAHQGPHGLSEVLYAFSSAAGNNGSSFGGLTSNTPFYNNMLSCALFFGRFGVILPVLGLAGLLARKKALPESAGTFPAHGPLFGTLLLSVALIVGALTFLPALVLGPIVEHLMLFK